MKQLVSAIVLSLVLVNVLGFAFLIRETEESGTFNSGGDGSVDPSDAPVFTFDDITLVADDARADLEQNVTMTITRPAGECWIVLTLIPPDAEIVNVENVSGFNRIVLFRELFFRCYKFACIVFEVANTLQPDVFNITYTCNDTFDAAEDTWQDELADPVIHYIREKNYSTVTTLFCNLDKSSLWKGYPCLSVNKTDGFFLQGNRCEYLVIVPESWMPSIEPLVKWKEQKGLVTYTATLEWINEAYGGKDLQWRIREFIKDAFNVWQIRYVVLAGGNDLIPSRQIVNYQLPPYPNHTIVNDAYYACLDGTWDENENGVFNEASEIKHPKWGAVLVYEADWFPELSVGRFPATNETELSIMINKTLEYEQQPPQDAWFNNFLGIAGWGYARFLRPLWPTYLNQTWLEGVAYFPDYIVNSTTLAVINYLNMGQGLVFHQGHGGPTGWQVALETGEGLLSENVSSLNNEDRLPIVFSEGCHTALFSIDNNIAAAFLKNPNGGAVLYIGCTGLGGNALCHIRDWLFGAHCSCIYEGGESNCSWSEFPVQSFRPGSAFFQGSFQMSTRIANALTASLLGDPEMAWTSERRWLNVTFPKTVLAGQDLILEVNDANNSEPLPSCILRIIQNNTWSELVSNKTGQVAVRVPDHACLLNLTIYALYRNTPTKYGCIVKVIDYPSANFTYFPINPLANHTVTFNANLSVPNGGTILSYCWDFGDGSHSEGVIVSHNYSQVGIYNVSLIVVDDEGLNDIRLDMITILTHDLAIVSVALSTSEIYLGQSVNISVVVQNCGNFTEAFSVTAFANNTIIQTLEIFDLPPSNQTAVTLVWSTANGNIEIGNYTVWVRTNVVPDETHVSDNIKVCGDVIVARARVPTANAGDDQTVNEDTPTTLDGSASTDNVGTTAYTWTFTDVTLKTLTGEKPTYTFNTPGVYTVTLNVTDGAGNWATDTVVITVVDVTKPVADAGEDRTVNVGTTVAFDAGSCTDNVGIVSFEWNFGDGTIDTSIRCNHSYTELGDYMVTLTVKDAAGNLGTDTIIVTVIEEAPAPFPWWILGLAAAVTIGTAAVVSIFWRKKERDMRTRKE